MAEMHKELQVRGKVGISFPPASQLKMKYK